MADAGTLEVVLGVVLTQGTARNNAARAIDSLKRARSHRPEAIRQLSSARLAALIRPTGFHKVKAARLRAVANW